MNIIQIEQNIQDIIENLDKENFIFDFLVAFDEAKSTITKLKKSELNQLQTKGELTHRKKLFFKVSEENLYITIEELKKDKTVLRSKPRFIIVTDFKKLLAYDTKLLDTLDIGFEELIKHYDFFLPLAGMEKTQFQDENPADVKASIKLAKLYDEIVKTNEIKESEEIHALNVFLTRLLFCYFAEDTQIFSNNQFTNAIKSHTAEDGSDLDSYLQRLFEVFNSPKKDSSLPEYLQKFPYVNGGLFKDSYKIPRFTYKSRKFLIEAGTLAWQDINPDIFGSMIQAVISPDKRGNMGMHYTSVPNIMKVIQPLFLDELEEEFSKAKGNTNKLNKLHQRISSIKIFDPACGSGNFLIITYKKLRELEMKIFREGGLLISPSIKLTQFYGIELDDFAHEVAQLSLWLAEHQMNMEFKKEFGVVPPPLPLSDNGNIVQGNATRLDWEEVCPKEDGDEIYILGNPPFEGARKQKPIQKEDMKIVFDGIKGFNNLDYVACWFYKGAKYIKGINAKLALVSTNSISQGEQVGILWTHILKDDIEIDFAYRSFKWKNNAKDNAQVIVVIIGIRNKSVKPKYLYQFNLKQEVKNINAYLVNSDNIFIQKRMKPLFNVSEMSFGNMPNDGGNLLLTDEEKEELTQSEPLSEKYIKKLLGSVEFLNSKNRWCLWLKDLDLDDLEFMPNVKNRIEQVKQNRLKSSREATKKLANYPHLFGEIRQPNNDYIIMPLVSSANRYYIPIGHVSSDVILTNRCSFVPSSELSLLGTMMSSMHMSWVHAISGRLKSDYNYSIQLVYNNFPFPNITEQQKEEITNLVFNILDEREYNSPKTLAELYDPDKMPDGLKKAHQELDRAIEKCYRDKPFENDEERLEYLFKIYEEMVASEKNGK